MKLKITLITTLFFTILFTFTSCETDINAEFEIHKIINGSTYTDTYTYLVTDTTKIYRGDTLELWDSFYGDNEIWEFSDGAYKTDYYSEYDNKLEYGKSPSSFYFDTVGIVSITHTVFSYTMRQENTYIQEINILPGVLLKVTVLDIEEENIDEAEVKLFETEADWQNKENPIRIDITNYSGQVRFNHLEAKTYYIYAERNEYNNSETIYTLFLEEGINNVSITIK